MLKEMAVLSAWFFVLSAWFFVLSAWHWGLVLGLRCF